MKLSPAEVARYYAGRLPNLKQVGPQWRCPCPVHGGKRPSFAVNPTTGEAFCHSECGRGWSIEQLEAALSGTDRAKAAEQVHEFAGSKKKITAVYPYTDESGKPLFECVRYEPKGFSQRRKLNGSYVYTLGDVRKVLYCLPEVVKAAEVIVVEGEKDVHTLNKLGLVATTSPMGAGKWRREYATPLKDKHVTIIPDADEPGLKHCIDVATSLVGVARSVRVVRLKTKDVSDWVAAGGTAEQLRKLIAEATVQTHESIAKLKFGAEPKKRDEETPFRLTPKGVIYIDPDPDKQPVRICGPLTIAAKTRDHNSDDWGRLLTWSDDDGRQHQWAMPMSILAGDGREAVERLLAGGLQIGAGQRAKGLLNNYLQTYPVRARAKCVTKVGWHSDCFVLPDQTYGSHENESVIYQSQYDTECWVTISGTLDDWRRHVSLDCKGNSRLLLAASSGFAGPILRLLGVESGGVHYIGNTSTGKSTALVVGGSVCGGGGPNGFVQSWRATTNGLEAVASNHNDLTLYLDEIAQINPNEAAETAYLLSNGSGKSRMTRAITGRRKLNWRLLFVSAGEVTLADHALTKGKTVKGGAEVRLLNVSADAGVGMGMFEDTHGMQPEEFARRIKSAATAYYGSAIRAFLHQITTPKADWLKLGKSLQATMTKRHLPAKCGGEVARSLSRFTSLAVAGELATRMGITGWAEGEAECGIMQCFRSWLDARGSTQSSDLERAVRQVQHFLELHGSSRFQVIRNAESDQDQIVHNRAGFRTTGDEIEYFVLPEVFRKEICAGYDARHVAAELSRRGFLAPGGGNHAFTPNRRLPGLGQRRVYVLNSALLGDSERA